MPATHDVSINGVGYMLVPGGYRYEQSGAEIERVRAGVSLFAGDPAPAGDGRTVLDRDDARWVAVGMMPVPAGIGLRQGPLVLGPKEQQLNVAATTGANFDANSHGIVYSGKVYVSVGANLYSCSVNGSNQLTGVTLIGAAGGTILGMAVIGGLLYMATSAAGTMSNYAGSGAIANTPAANAGIVWSYASGLWRSKGSPTYTVASGSIDGGATWTDWQLDSTIRAATYWPGRATGGGVMLIGTQYALWELAGQWTGSPAAFSGTVSLVFDGRGGGGTDDFAYLADYRGNVYTWYAGTLHRWDGRNLLPVAGAPRGAIIGLCVAGDLLVMLVNDAVTGVTSIVAYDGQRVVTLQRAVSSWYNCFGTNGLISDGHLVTLDRFSGLISRWELPVAGLTANPAATGQVILGPLDAGQGDAVKVWTQIAVDWGNALYPSGTSAPADPGGLLAIAYSTDEGITYTAAGTIAVPNAATAGQAVQALNGGVGIEAARLVVRVTWTPTSAYAGLQLLGVWASGYRVKDLPKLEAWTLDIRCTDRLIRRDDAVDTRTGEQMLTALRALAQAGGVIAYQDIDFDLSARSVNVRVIGFEERDRKADASRAVESVCRLTVAAVN